MSKISTEKPKQETLEEAAEKYADKQSDSSMRKNELEFSKSGEELWQESKEDFIAGAKWQAERMYSEEEVKEILFHRETEYLKTKSVLHINEWFKQFKKK